MQNYLGPFRVIKSTILWQIIYNSQHKKAKCDVFAFDLISCFLGICFYAELGPFSNHITCHNDHKQCIYDAFGMHA